MCGVLFYYFDEFLVFLFVIFEYFYEEMIMVFCKKIEVNFFCLVFIDGLWVVILCFEFKVVIEFWFVV